MPGLPTLRSIESAFWRGLPGSARAVNDVRLVGRVDGGHIPVKSAEAVAAVEACRELVIPDDPLLRKAHQRLAVDEQVIVVAELQHFACHRDPDPRRLAAGIGFDDRQFSAPGPTGQHGSEPPAMMKRRRQRLVSRHVRSRDRAFHVPGARFNDGNAVFIGAATRT